MKIKVNEEEYQKKKESIYNYYNYKNRYDDKKAKELTEKEMKKYLKIKNKK